MTEEMKKYGDASTDDEIRQYPKLRRLLERKLERKKKQENLDASRNVLSGNGVKGNGKRVGATPQGDPYADQDVNLLLLELLVRASDLAIRIRWAAFPVVS